MAPKAVVMILALIGAPGSHGLPTVDDELARAQRNVSAARRHGNVPCYKRGNAQRPVLILFGAFGRHNFGDLLMPHVVSTLLAQYPHEQQVVYADLDSADMRPFGGHCVAAIGDLLRMPGRTNVVHVGGETIGVSVGTAAAFIGKPISSLPWHPASTGTSLRLGDPAYVLDKRAFRNPGAFIANSIGGTPAGPEEPRLRQFDFIGVREHRTLHALRGRGLPAQWTPDSVFALRALFEARIRTTPRSVLRIQRACSETGYVAVQLKESYLKSFLRAANAIRAAQTAAGAPVVLFRAAAASRHDSLEAYDRAGLPRLHVFDDLDTWSIVSLITRARLVITTSLHVQVIAALWGVPRLQLSFHEKLDSNLAEFESPTLLREGRGLIHPTQHGRFTKNDKKSATRLVKEAVAWLLSPEGAPYVRNTSATASLGRRYMESVRKWQQMLQPDGASQQDPDIGAAMSFCSKEWFEGPPASQDESTGRRMFAVISHCSADLSWLQEFLNSTGKLQRAVIISKCGRTPNWNSSRVTQIIEKNIGRCDHTYAKWIAQNVDKVHPDDIIFFMKDTHSVHQSGSEFQSFDNMYRLAGSGYACGTRHKSMSIFHNTTVLGSLEKTSYKGVAFHAGTLNEWWARLNISVPMPFTPVCYGGQFATTGRQLRQVPTGVWSAIIRSLEAGNNIAEGHYAERTWAGLLFPKMSDQFSDNLRLHAIRTVQTYTGGYLGTLADCNGE